MNFSVFIILERVKNDSMLKIESHMTGIDTGEQVMFSDFEDDGPMWKGQGPRQSRHKVKFSQRFNTIPVVQVNLSMWDADSKTNLRGDLQAENVTRDGFELVFRTWGDSRVARIRTSWMAIGPVGHEEEWDLY